MHLPEHQIVIFLLPSSSSVRLLHKTRTHHLRSCLPVTKAPREILSACCPTLIHRQLHCSSTASPTRTITNNMMSSSPLLDELPVELRNNIYRSVLVSEGPLRIGEVHKRTALLRSCTQILKEGVAFSTRTLSTSLAVRARERGVRLGSRQVPAEC